MLCDVIGCVVVGGVLRCCNRGSRLNPLSIDVLSGDKLGAVCDAPIHLALQEDRQ